MSGEEKGIRPMVCSSYGGVWPNWREREERKKKEESRKKQ